LFICFEKSSEVYNLQNPLTGIDRVAPPAGAGNYVAKWGTTAAARNAFNDRDNTNNNLMNKDTAAATHEDTFNQEIATRYLAQNTCSNAAIMQLEITVQSAVGSFSFKASADPWLRDRDDLWRVHAQNCCDSYIRAGRGKWQDRASCALLSVSDWLLGLQTSPGTVFPIILDIKVKFANRAALASGLCFTNGQTKGQQVRDDFIIGSPVVVGLFNQQILSIASSSAVISSQAFSQSTTAAALAQQG
jgi:hypothetical protein